MSIFSDVTGFLITRFMNNLMALIAFFIAAILVNVYMYREYLHEKRRYKAARTEWAKVTGKVTSTRRHDGAGYQSVGHWVAGSHYNMVTYNYEAGKKSYKKTEYINEDRSFLDRFPKDAEVTVFYNPLNPKDAMWEYRVEPKLGLLKFLNIIILIFAILTMLFNLQS
jgi:hypothetical protein